MEGGLCAPSDTHPPTIITIASKSPSDHHHFGGHGLIWQGIEGLNLGVMEEIAI